MRIFLQNGILISLQAQIDSGISHIITPKQYKSSPGIGNLHGQYYY